MILKGGNCCFQYVAIVVVAVICQSPLFQAHSISRARQRQPTLAMVTPSSLTTPIPPPPSISMPVWVLAAPISDLSSSSTEQETSMCIITYASAVSVAPPKLWIISLYANTLTRNSFCSTGGGVLQLLTSNHKQLVPILGKRSGYEPNFSKREECEKYGFPWFKAADHDSSSSNRLHFLSSGQRAWQKLDLLPKCAAYIYVKLMSLTDAGDHEVALCEVVGTGFWDETIEQVRQSDDNPTFLLDHKSALYTGELRSDGIL